MAHTRVYRKGVLEAEGFPVSEVSEHLEHQDCVIWVDLCDPSADELHELASELGLHELAVEDSIEWQQRPKLDHYATHLFLSCRAVRLEMAEGRLIESEVDSFVNPRWLVTVRRDDAFPIDDVTARWDRSPDLLVHGTGFLLYGLLDVIVDGYFEAVRAFEDFYDEVSEGIFTEHPIELSRQRQWFQVRQALVRFHRLVGPVREMVSALMRRERDAVDEELYPYYQDVYDHVLRVSESSEALRDLVSTIVETNLALRDYRLNQVVKKVTGWAAIIAVPTLITGFYGMNVPYPGYGNDWGLFTSLVLLVVLTLGLYLVFKRKDWI